MKNDGLHFVVRTSTVVFVSVIYPLIEPFQKMLSLVRGFTELRERDTRRDFAE